MWTKSFNDYIKLYFPEMDTDKKEKSLKIFIKCINNKNNVITECNKTYYDIENALPIIVAKKFQKLFFDNNQKRRKYELKGKFILGSCAEYELNESFFPYFFEKGTVKAELVDNGELSKDILFLDLLKMVTGEVAESKTLVMYKTYSHEMDKAIDTVLNCLLDSVIGKFAEGILELPYEECDDIKRAVNGAVFEVIKKESILTNLKDCDEFSRFVGWEDKTISDILELAKEEVI